MYGEHMNPMQSFCKTVACQGYGYWISAFTWYKLSLLCFSQGEDPEHQLIRDGIK